MAEQKKPPTSLVRKMATDADLRNLLREVGPDRTMSQSEIADQTGLSRELINRIERGAIMKVSERIKKLMDKGGG